MDLINVRKAEHIKKNNALFLGGEEVNYSRISTFRTVLEYNFREKQRMSGTWGWKMFVCLYSLMSHIYTLEQNHNVWKKDKVGLFRNDLKKETGYSCTILLYAPQT
jgi:hypothetical protein